MSALRIDVHAHLWTVDYLDRLERLGKADTGTQRELCADATEADLDHRFALMDRAGIDLQVLSVAPQSPHLSGEPEAVALARAANDSYAELVARFPGRFRAFAALPLPHVDAALHEATRAFDDLGAVGVGVTTTVLGRTLADPLFHPVYEELDRRGAVLCIHPSGEGAASPLITEHDMTWMVGAPVEDTVAIMHLILAGLPARYPRMRILASHLGGALPCCPADSTTIWPSSPPGPRTPLGGRRPPLVRHGQPCARTGTGRRGRVLRGRSTRARHGLPYEDDEVFVRSVNYVCESGLTQEEAAAILDTNAADLLGLSET